MGSAASRVSPNKPKYKTSKNADKPARGIQVFIGPYIHSLSWTEPLVVQPNGVIGVKDGKIVIVDTAENLDTLKASHSFGDSDIIKLQEGEFLMPGLIDTHIHAPQYPNVGIGLDLPLLEWLDKYTFPLEAKYKDPKFAELVYRKVVEKTINNGTTTASYFTTIHTSSSEVMADMVEAYGQRALVGKVCMDCYSPDYYVETTEESLSGTTEFVKKILDRKNPLVLPTITPRFALTCSEDLLKGLGAIAKEHDVHIQTHLDESIPEIERAMELFPQYKNYADIYGGTGLLSSKAIMAHCVHITDEELEILKENNTSISHCPTSNNSLLSGHCPVKKLRNAGVKVGLGTDVAGGYTPSILEEMRHAIMTAKTLSIEGRESEPLTFREALYLATLGGAEALAMEQEIGNFQVGKSFDALVIGLEHELSPIDLFPESDINVLVEKFIMLGDDRNIVKVFVNGQLVKSY
ncbi:Guanine deaminase [Orchesella cincta]|uniref:Guanine deaminase n=1 Tax=Orchesella cincta TaxID=48709 RepID=A0A1D2NBP2_ORCCI|nr:Guanine deaminase [Orchesella cincta]